MRAHSTLGAAISLPALVTVAGVINTTATSSPNWVSGDDTKFGYDSESVAPLCSEALA